MDYTTLCTREEGSPVDYQMLCEKRWQLQKTLPGIPDQVISKFDKAFEIEYAHNSTAIEGNTLTLVQTKAILEDGLSVGGKTLREIYEVANHARAFSYVKDCIAKGRPLDEQVIKDIHARIMEGYTEMLRCVSQEPITSRLLPARCTGRSKNSALCCTIPET